MNGVDSGVKTENNKIPKIVLCASAAFVALVFVVGGIHFATKVLPYQDALNSFEQGSYVEALEKFMSLEDYRDSADFVNRCYYEQGKQLLLGKDFQTAKLSFLNIPEYLDSTALIQDCDYQIAINLFEQKKYAMAIESFSVLGHYKDTLNYLKKSQIGLKYETFDATGAAITTYYDETPLSDYAVKTQEEAEEALSTYLYNTWFEAETGEELPIDLFRMGNNPYCVRAAVPYLGECLDMVFYYPEKPSQLYYAESYLSYVFSMNVFFLNIYPIDAPEEVKSYSLLSPDEFAEAERQWLYEQAQAEMARAMAPAYSDETIANQTLKTFKSKLSNGPDPATLYQNVSADSYYVEYDGTEMVYTCYMTVTHSTNIFDIWGTSKTTYSVTAQFKDTGSDLVLIGFSVA